MKIINATEHKLDFAYAEPETLDVRKIDYTVPVSIILRGEWKEKIIPKGNIRILYKRLEISEGEKEKLINYLQQEKIKEGVLIISYPLLRYAGEELEEYCRNRGYNIEVVSTVPATVSRISPPVSVAGLYQKVYKEAKDE